MWEQDRALRKESERQHREKFERVWEEIRASRVDTDRVITSIENRLDAIHRELGGIGKTLGGVSEGLGVVSKGLGVVSKACAGRR